MRNEDTFKLFLQRCGGLSYVCDSLADASGEAGLKTELLPLEPMSRENPTFWDTALDLGARVEVVRITRS